MLARKVQFSDQFKWELPRVHQTLEPKNCQKPNKNERG